jgi:pimeloyl-ACP methyl ester carboxylesterase
MHEAMRIFGTAALGVEFYSRLSSSRMEQVRANAIGAEFLGSGFDALKDEDVRGVQVPTLLIGGQHSPSFFHRLLDRLEELLPHSDRVEIGEASHITHEDNGKAFDRAVRAFLDANSPS